jgi:predicted O-methyltransferase YrrM
VLTGPDWLAVARSAVTEHGAAQKPGELAGLLEVLEQVRPRVIVEIGCDAGGTLWAWSQLPGPPRVIGVDLPGGPYSAAAFPEVHGAELIIGNSHHKGTFTRLAGTLGGDQADVLFIDADHTYAGVAADYHGYRPLVRPGGLIVFHDIVPHPHIPSVGVRDLWTEITGHWPATEIITDTAAPWGGIGILVNTPLPAPEPVRVPAR